MNPELPNNQRQPESQNEAEILRSSKAIQEAVRLPDSIKEAEWRECMRRAFVPVETPNESNVKNPTPNRLAFIRMEYEKIQLEEKKTKVFLTGAVREAAERAPYAEKYPEEAHCPDIYAPISLARVAGLIDMKHKYGQLMREEPIAEPSDLPSYLQMALMTLPETKVAELLPLQQSSADLKKLDFAKARQVILAEKNLSAQLQKAGIKNADFAQFLAKLPRSSSTLIGKLIKKATPNSYYDIFLMSYFLHESEDKMGATLNFATFLAAQGLAQVAIETTAARFAVLRTMPVKHPIVMTMIALAITIGLDKVVGFDKIVSWAESKVDPALWNAGGNVAEIISGSKLIDDAGEIGYMTGLRSVDPQSGQKDFLGSKLFQIKSRSPFVERLMRFYQEGATFDAQTAYDLTTLLEVDPQSGLKKDFFHSMRDWDEQVESIAVEAEQNGNQMQADYYRLMKIGSISEWADREAVTLYRKVETLKGLQDTFNGMIGMAGSAVAFDLSQSAVLKQDIGDTHIPTLLQTQQYENIRQKIAQLPEGKQRNEAQALYDQCVSIAKSIARDVSMYTHLGVYEESWTKQRSVDGELLLPESVERGMISTLALQSKRRNVLKPTAQNPDQFGKDATEMAGKYLNDSLFTKIITALDTKVNQQRDFLAQEYANLKSAIERAQRELSPQDLEKALIPLQDLILKGEGAKEDDLRKATQALLSMISNSSMRGSSLVFMGNKKSNSRYNPIPCFNRGADASMFNVTIGTSKADLIILEGDGTGATARSLEFRCETGNRADWNIDVTTLNRAALPRNGSLTSGYSGEKISFSDWSAQNPDAAAQLEPEFAKLEEAGRKKDASLKEEEEQRQREKNAELSERDRLLLQTKAQPGVWFDYPTRFVDIKKGEVPYQYISYSQAANDGKGAYLFLQTPESFDPKTLTVRNNNPQDRAVLGNDYKTRVGILREGETEIRREEVTMQSLPSLESGDVRAAWLHDAVLAPIPGKPREAISKVLALCKPVSQDLFFNLMNALEKACPSDVEGQRQFLFELYRQMPRTDVLYYNEMVRISRVMNAFNWGGIDNSLKREAGNAAMNSVDPFDEGDHFTKQYGWVGNKWLRAKFDGANGWRVGLGSLEDATHDPSGYSVDMWGGTDSYNALIGRLAEANNHTLYPAAKQALAKKGAWVMDQVRGDGLGGKIEYVAASDGRVFAQTTDGTRTWIHDFMSGAGIEQHGKYFSGLGGVLKPIPDANTHHYDLNLHEWVPNDYNKEKIYWDNLYPVAKVAVDSYGTWIPDNVRQDQYKGRIEYICWPDNKTGKIYSQTTDGLDCRIHDPRTNRGIAQTGKYFDGVEHALKYIPDTATHEYDAARRTWVPKSTVIAQKG